MIAIVYDVEKYRALLEKKVKEGDTVIEIGPHVGKSTVSYIEKAELAVVVDKGGQSEEVFLEMEKEYSNLRFIRGDVRSFETVERVAKLVKKCDVFALDMGGGRYPDTVFKVWATWSGIFQPPESLIRNRGLAEFVQRADVLDDSVKQEFPDDGWMSTWGRSVPYRFRKQLEEFKFWVDV